MADEWIVAPLIARGFVVVSTDYEGLGVPGPHPYLLGASEGRSVLDAIRAARVFPGIETSDRIALIGYSQGGHAVLWAAQLAPSYAPDLHVGAVVASAPVADLVAVADHWATTPGQQPYLLFALTSWSAFYGLPIDPVLTERGTGARHQVLHRCAGQLDWKAFGSGLFRKDSADWTRWLELARANTPGRKPLAAPVLVQHGDADTLIPIDSSRALVHGLCRHGTSAELRIYAGADHDVLSPGLGDAISWTIETLLGNPRLGSCRG
jgi:pimeloyl-ACP methyl ester carboxylesterase